MKSTLTKHLALACVFLFASLGAAHAASSIGYFDTIKKDPAPEPGKEYYLRYNLMYEKNSWDPTNYWRGSLLPVNTKVTFVSFGDKGMSIQVVNGGTRLNISNSKYTKRSMAEIAKNMLSPNPVPIEKFDKDIQACIKSGTLKLGMTKEQVIIARGYPPGHKTPSLDGDTWTYWSSRFVVITYVFEGGVLSKGRGLE